MGKKSRNRLETFLFTAFKISVGLMVIFMVIGSILDPKCGPVYLKFLIATFITMFVAMCFLISAFEIALKKARKRRRK